MSAKLSPKQRFLELMQREMGQPALSMEEALSLPLAKILLPTLEAAHVVSETPEAPKPDPSMALIALVQSRAVVAAAISDTYLLTELNAEEEERNALLVTSDLVMIQGTRRLRVQDAPRAGFIHAARKTELYKQMLREATLADSRDHEAIGRDPVRLPTAWLRALLTGEIADLSKAPPQELKAALAARERLQLVRGLPSNIPSFDTMRDQVGLAEFLEPLRLLIGAEGGWDGTPPRDRFIGRVEERRRLRAFVDEVRSRTVFEAITRLGTRTARNLVGEQPKDLIMVQGQGGLGKSTLLAKFMLEHALEQSRKFPFAYLDFDRASIDPERSQQLLVEIAGQVALQFPSARAELEELRARIRSEATMSLESADTFNATIRDPYSEFVEILREHATLQGERPFLLVLDTLEVVQWNTNAMRGLGELITMLRTRGLDELKVVASGRAEVPELTASRPDLVDKPIVLAPLSVEEGRALCSAIGKTAFGDDWESEWSRIIAGSRDDRSRREPLALRVAVDLIARAEADRRDDLIDNIAREGPEENDDFVARIYEKRILGHVRDPYAQKLAWPGLVLRRLTIEIVRDFLAEICGLRAEDAEKAFIALGQEVWMVTREGNALRHRADLRARTLPLMRRKPEFGDVASRAVSYFGERRDRSRENYLEWIYHRLLIGESPESVERDLRPEMVQSLASAEQDFQTGSPAWSFLAAHMGGSRLRPTRIAMMLPADALYHLKSSAATVFGFDDEVIDRPVLDLSQRLAVQRMVRRPELFSWARALQVKTGAWRGLRASIIAVSRSSNLFGPEFEAELFWAARIAPQYGGRIDAFMLSLEAIRDAVSDPEVSEKRLGLHAAIQGMALAAILKRTDIFGTLDREIGRRLSRTRLGATPSTIAALRTAIVLGRACRRPALSAWLALRSRGSSEQTPATFSGAEIQALGMLRAAPDWLEILMSEGILFEGPARIEGHDVVGEVARLLDEALDDLEDSSEENPVVQALARMFMCRDEDWIVPIGYAAARALPGPLPDRILQRSESYRNAKDKYASVSTKPPRDMLEAARFADEASDLAGFVDLVLSEQRPNERAEDLQFLVKCRNEWHLLLSSLVGRSKPDPIRGDSAVPRAATQVDKPPPPGPVTNREDPQKGRWGGKYRRAGRAVKAVLESVGKDIFYFSLIVESIDKTPLEGPVVFHLHDTYARGKVTVRRIADKKFAKLSDYEAYGVFSIGVQVKDSEGKWTSLELDLAGLKGIPKRFLKR